MTGKLLDALLTGGILMATMDIFEGDAFTIVELTRALENIPYKPALLSGSNLFSPRGVRSRTVVIESRDGTLSLIPFSERGSAYESQVPGRTDVCRVPPV
ncbi:MAG: major capsid protein [Rhodobacteraceae bacterium]|nr:major capsid protein [Paracoccaceae bacterium]